MILLQVLVPCITTLSIRFPSLRLSEVLLLDHMLCLHGVEGLWSDRLAQYELALEGGERKMLLARNNEFGDYNGLRLALWRPLRKTELVRDIPPVRLVGLHDLFPDPALILDMLAFETVALGPVVRHASLDNVVCGMCYDLKRIVKLRFSECWENILDITG